MKSNDHLCSLYHLSMSTHRHLNNLNQANRRQSYAVTTSTATVNPTYSYITQTQPIPVNQPRQTINQPIPIRSQPYIPTPTLTTRAYTGSHPLCLNCTYHHLTTASCRLCTTCNRLGHFATSCRVNIHLNSTITPPTRGCYNCGDPDHFKRMCPKLQTTPAPQTNDDQDQPFVQRPGKAPEEASVP
jgi:hypothetical protein